MYKGNPDVSDDVFNDVLKQVTDFVRERVVPRESEIMASDAIPVDHRSQAAEMGLFGYALPQKCGGLGLDLVQDVELAMVLGYTSLSLRSMFGTNNGIAGQVIMGIGTEAQKERWLPALATGEAVASFALTEPGAGSNPTGLRTRARHDGDSWVIDGSKQFITHAPQAGLFVVFARYQPPTDTGNGTAVLPVPADTPGVEVGVKDAKMRQEGTHTAERLYRDVRLLRLYQGTSEIQRLIIGGGLIRAAKAS